MNSRRTHSRSGFARGKNINWKGWIRLLIIIVVLLYSLIKVYGLLFSNTRTADLSVSVKDLTGPAEFKIEGDDDTWTPLYLDQQLFTGDSIRTNTAQMALNIVDESNRIAFTNSSEMLITQLKEKSSKKRLLDFELLKGNIFAHIAPTLLKDNDDSMLTITTPQAVYSTKTADFAIDSHPDSGDVLRVFEGKVRINYEYKDAKNKDKEGVIDIGLGQQITVNSDTKNTLDDPTAIQKIDDAYLESTWYIDNIAVFDSIEADVMRKKIAAKKALEEGIVVDSASDTTPTEPVNTLSTVPKPLFTSPQNGATIAAKANDTVIITGSSNPQIKQIVVNNYTLSLYKPGDTKWTYYASIAANTLKKGLNSYTVKGIDMEGKETDMSTLQFNYVVEEPVNPVVEPITPPVNTPVEPPKEPIKPAEKPAITPTQPTTPIVEEPIKPVEKPIVEDTLTPPTISYPPASPFETASPKLTITGGVASSVVRVDVNGYRLKQFVSGSGKWKFMANADMGNMNVGENTFTVTAYTASGVSSSTSVKVVYTPI